jgi:hypothetical protein
VGPPAHLFAFEQLAVLVVRILGPTNATRFRARKLGRVPLELGERGSWGGKKERGMRARRDSASVSTLAQL